jgi:hypothetical protein
MSRWFKRRSAWQIFAIVLAGIMACVVSESAVRADGHLGIGTLEHLALYSVITATCVTVGVQLGTKARRRRDTNADT